MTKVIFGLAGFFGVGAVILGAQEASGSFPILLVFGILGLIAWVGSKVI